MPLAKISLYSFMRFFVLCICSLNVGYAQDPADNDAPAIDEPSNTETPSKSASTKASQAKSKNSKSKSRANDSPGAKEPGENESGEDEEESTPGIQLFAPRKMEMQFGMRFFANDNWCTDLRATMPFPMNWPEQRVVVTSSEIPDQFYWEFRDLPAGSKQNAYARQLVMKYTQLGPNNQLNLLVNVEIEKAFIDPPPDTSVFVIPKKLTKELNWFMGSSPYIDVEIGEIKRVAKQIAAKEPATAWEHVELIYDWVRENIKYRNGPIRKIADALKDKQGDCEEMTGIFVALCRASKIPARCVWVPEHCYPEFYLEDPQGEGHWFPCQAAGERQFGQMHDYRPILQKGDRFKVPEENTPIRYLTHFFACKQRPVAPQGRDVAIEPVLDLGPLQEELDALRAATDRPAE
jgi:hypothetical protein